MEEIKPVIPFIDLELFVVHNAMTASDTCLDEIKDKKIETFLSWDELLINLFDIYVRENIKDKRLQACKVCIGNNNGNRST